MGLFNKKYISRKDLEKILKAQETKMRAASWEKEKTLINEYENKIKILRSTFDNRITDTHNEHDNKLKAINYKKAKLFKKLLEEKDKELKKLEEDNKTLLKTLRKYKEAYELYRSNRNRIFEVALEMGDASEKVALTAARMDSFFSRIKNIAEIHMKKGHELDAKVEELMYVNEPTQDEAHLKLIERKVEKVQIK